MPKVTMHIRHEFDNEINSLVAKKVREFRMQIAPEGFFDIDGSPIDLRPLTITLSTENDEVIAALTGATFFQSLSIKWLWVDEAYRNNGHARDMLLKAIDIAKERGAKFAYGDTWEPLGAYSLFEKLGAELVWRQVFGDGSTLLHYRLDF